MVAGNFWWVYYTRVCVGYASTLVWTFLHENNWFLSNCFVMNSRSIKFNFCQRLFRNEFFAHSFYFYISIDKIENNWISPNLSAYLFFYGNNLWNNKIK